MSGEERNEVRGGEKPRLMLKIKLRRAEAETAIKEAETSTVTELSSIPTCRECFKQFASKKALYGHMRCHGHRKYRGMVPPAQENRASVEGCSVGLTEAWSREWPSEPRKPRGGVAASSSSVSGDAEEDELKMGAAFGLMLLATGDDRYRSLPGSNNKEGIIRVSPELEANYINGGSVEKKRKSCSQGMDMKMMKPCKIKKIGMKKVSEEDGCGARLDPSQHDESSVSHVCKECGKEFPSGQALGGHMRLHYKQPLVAQHIIRIRLFDLNKMPADHDYSYD